MIKQINSTEDIEKCIGLLELFLQDTAYKDIYRGRANHMHLGRLVHLFMHKHYVWLAEIDGEPAGILIALKESNIWSPGQQQLRELVWYVKPEYRSGAIGGRLFVTYCQCAEELKSKGEIDGYFTTRMTTTTDINLTRRGFKLMVQTYLKD
jgi:hypothetical protein